VAASEARAQGLYDSIRREVDASWQDYRSAAAEHDRLAAGSGSLVKRMSAQIDALSIEPTVRREDVLTVREELVEYQRTCMKAEYDYLRLTQDLESVSGGSLSKTP